MGLFISYRREDSPDATGRIYDRLASEFGRENIFMDVDDIPLSSDFRKYIEEVLKKTHSVLVVIGPKWLDAKDAEGRRRLDEPRDFVRLEIETALTRNIPVIPLLVRGASMPSELSLPDSLKALAYRHGTPVRSDRDFERDMDWVIGAVRDLLPLSGRQLPQLLHRVLLTGAAGHGKTTLISALTKVGGSYVAPEEIERFVGRSGEKPQEGVARITVDRPDALRIEMIDITSDQACERVLRAPLGFPDGAVLVVDASNGPLQSTKAQLEFIHNRQLPLHAVFVSRLDLLDDTEEADLVEADILDTIKRVGCFRDDLTMLRGSALLALQGKTGNEGTRSINRLLTVFESAARK